jgi:S-adenosylmethionine synthetase
LKDDRISEWVAEAFDMRPAAIVKRFGLKDPIFAETAAYGHFGRQVEEKEIEVFYNDTKDKSIKTKKAKDGSVQYFKKVKLFGWEELDRVKDIIKYFDILNVPAMEELDA